MKKMRLGKCCKNYLARIFHEEVVKVSDVALVTSHYRLIVYLPVAWPVVLSELKLTGLVESLVVQTAELPASICLVSPQLFTVMPGAADSVLEFCAVTGLSTLIVIVSFCPLPLLIVITSEEDLETQLVG
jgi:hypothetical protein